MLTIDDLTTRKWGKQISFPVLYFMSALGAP